jgi:hypothetical protein
MTNLRPGILCALSLLIPAASALTTKGPGTPEPLPPPAVAVLHGPGTPEPLPPPAMA